jgi:hypothetical protein
MCVVCMRRGERERQRERERERLSILASESILEADLSLNLYSSEQNRDQIPFILQFCHSQYAVCIEWFSVASRDPAITLTFQTMERKEGKRCAGNVSFGAWPVIHVISTHVPLARTYRHSQLSGNWYTLYLDWYAKSIAI